MPDLSPIWTFLGAFVVACPALLTVVLGVSSLMGWTLPEARTIRYVFTAILWSLMALVTILVVLLVTRTRHISIDLGNWVEIPGYQISIKFVFDRLSVPFAILSIALSGMIAGFASREMRFERGFPRFFVLYALFVLGMVVTSLADTIETLFLGWELVGLSSALLVGFAPDRPNPARNGLWVWVVNRVSDAALLLAAVGMHHLSGDGDFDKFLGVDAWPQGHSSMSGTRTFFVGLLILAAASMKSGLVPFSGWLSRAMEGPTASSAGFFGAISVHLGAFLLLRMSPLLDQSIGLSGLVVVVGLTTAMFAFVAGRVQTDIKSAISFASLSQVGIIVAEIGFGLRYIALFHLLGHASLRTLQFLRAPGRLQDDRTLKGATGPRLPRADLAWDRPGAIGFRDRIYRLALDRGHLDSFLTEFVVRPFVRAFRWCDRLERRWTDFLTGGASRESDLVRPHTGTIEELS